MPVVCNKCPMAECVNCGLGNDDLRQRLKPPMFTDMLIRGLNDLNCVDLNAIPTQTEENDSPTLSLNTTQNLEDHVSSLVQNQLSNMPAKKELSNDLSEPCASPHNEANTERLVEENYQVPSTESLIYFLPDYYSKRNPWRRMIGFHAGGHELRSATYPARSSVKKLRFAQAKKPLNYLYSYFSVQILDCDDKSSITIGLCRKDYPSKTPPGRVAGSLGYCSDSGFVSVRDSIQLEGLEYSKGDIIGCGIIYPSHYKKYADLSTDDNSDGMTDVVLTSLLNKKSMNFVCNVLNLNSQESEPPVNMAAEPHCDSTASAEETDYYNENFVESRTQVEIYLTHNLQVIGKVLSHIPIGGFYPTVHVYSTSAIRLKVDLNPPAS